MRSIIKMLGLALFATLAFSAIGALGAGSASALLFLTLSGGELLFEIKSLVHFNKVVPADPAFLFSTGNFLCESLLGRGAILNKTDEARKILLEFHRCGIEGTNGFPGNVCRLRERGLFASAAKSCSRDRYSTGRGYGCQGAVAGDRQR